MQDIIQAKAVPESKPESLPESKTESKPESKPVAAKEKKPKGKVPSLNLASINSSVKAKKGSDVASEPVELSSGIQKTEDETNRAPHEVAAETVLPTVASDK